MTLLPGWQKELDRAAPPRSPATPPPLPVRIDLPRVAAEIIVVRTPTDAERLLQVVKGSQVAAIAWDSEFRFERPAFKLRSGASWYDVRGVQPICVSMGIWIADGNLAQGGAVVRAVVDVRDRTLVPLVGDLLRVRVPHLFHHLKPEIFSFWALGLDPDLHNLFDTYLAAACLHLGRHHQRAQVDDENDDDIGRVTAKAEKTRRKAHLLSLVGQCERYELAYPFSESKDDLRDEFLGLPDGQPLTGRMVDYAAADAEWTLRLHARQQSEVLRLGLHHHLHTVEFPFALANARMEWRGVHVAVDRLRKLREAATGAADYHARVLRDHGVDPPGSRPKFLQLMARVGLHEHFVQDGEPSTADEVLERCEELHPAIRAFRLHRRYRRLASEEWVHGALTGADGRTHPNHRQLGAATGRNSCTAPNIAGVGKVFRPVVTAPAGRALVELDYSQVEVGIAAAEHCDTALLAAYNSGDVYAWMAQRFYEGHLTREERDLSPVDFKARRSDLRNAMKTFVLAIIYNIQAKGLAARFRITEAAAERERTRFLNMFPVLKVALEESAAFGVLRGYAVTVSGLRRHVDKGIKARFWVKNLLRNTPIQGSAAVVFKRAVVMLDQAFRDTDVWLVLPIHDAILIECPAERLREIGERARQVMVDALHATYPALTPRVEINLRDPSCWNKDGHGDSLDRFLADPTFRIDRPVGEAVAPSPDAKADDGTSDILDYCWLTMLDQVCTFESAPAPRTTDADEPLAELTAAMCGEGVLS